jgi:hypothetical protein
MSDQETPSCNKQKTFVNLLKDVPVLLSKSQIPSFKERKLVASEKFILAYQKRSGLKLTKDQLSKKINNMRNSVKAKSDVKKTGNKPIKLTDWEQDFLDLVDSESNPSFSRVPGIIYSSFTFTRPVWKVQSKPSKPNLEFVMATFYINFF